MAVGKIGHFDLDKDNWDLYVERLEQYFIVNDVKEAVKVATLITVIGSEAYELMVNLCTPEKPSSKTFEQLVKVMKTHLQPQPSLLAERFKFRQRIQKADESIAEFVSELKKLSKYCKFSADSLKENLRDQFVCGLRNEYIRQRLFTEDDITFDMACKYAVSMEAAEANAAAVEGCTRGRSDSEAQAMHQLSTAARREQDGKHRRTRPDEYRAGRRIGDSVTSGKTGSSFIRDNNQNKSYRANFNMTCNVCGGRHDGRLCKYRLYVCRICNQEGHLKKMCPKSKESIPLFKVIDADHDSDGDTSNSDSDEVTYYSITSQKLETFEPYKLDVCVEDINLSMEVDTGSAISCISDDCYRNNFNHCELKSTRLILKYYTGEIVKPLGKISVDVKFQNKCAKLDLYVVNKGKTNLIGRQWLHELGINFSFTNCHSVKAESMSFNLEEFSSRYCKVFEDGLGKFTGGTVGFRLREGARPVFLRARPLAYALREPVERALDQLERDGVITPVSCSDWATPIVPVMKKDGTIRVCGDFKITLNKCLEVDRFPLPRVEDLLTKLHGGQKFTKLDLSQAYAQFELDESKKYTVINTHKGLYMYNRLIYGLASSPGIFQRKLEELFGDMPRVGVFLDDLIITGSDDKSHIDTLHEVFKRLVKYGLKIKKEKCTFFADSVTYLGFVISSKGVHTSPDKIKAIKEVPEPKNVTELRSFIGMVMYYSKFVPNMSTIMQPLYDLLKKDTKFEWKCCHSETFIKIKEMLTSSTVLAHYSSSLPLVLTTDASAVGVGAVISHLTPTGERPVAFASRTLNAAEKGYSQIEKEALAIIYGVRKFHQYLYGRNFILRTDHKPLVTIFGDKSGIPIMAASRMQRWAVILAGYNYKIEYIRSDKNAADALSRMPVDQGKRDKIESTYLHFVQNFLPVTRKMVIENIAKDKVLKKVFIYLQSGWPNHCDEEELKPYFNRRNELYLDGGCIVWGYRLVIPEPLREYLLKELHIGHLGMVKMKSTARSIVWWAGIDADIERTCRACGTCTAEAPAPPQAPPRPWPFATEPWSRLHVDFLGPFQGKTFLVIIDSTSKWIELFHMRHTKASSVIKVLRETFARFGLPKEIVSDNGPPFSSKEYADFMNKNGIRLTFTAVYHPSSNGAAEGAVSNCANEL